MSTSPIGALSSSSALQQLEALYQKMEAKLEASTASTTATSSTTASDSDSISGIGKMLSKLQDLATGDPAKFKQDTSSIAAALTEAAGKTTGDESTFLKELAGQFQKASNSGDASALAPKHHGAHHHPSVTSNSSSSVDQSSLFALLNSDSTTSGSTPASSLTGSQQTLLGSLLSSTSDAS